MNPDYNLADEFNSYDTMNILDTERIVSKNFSNKFSDLIDLVNICLEKAESHKTIKILEKIMTIKKRINRLQLENEKRSKIIENTYGDIRIKIINEKKLELVDNRISELISNCKTIIESVKCAEKDIDLNKKMKRVNKYLKEIEVKCHERKCIFFKEELH